MNVTIRRADVSDAERLARLSGVLGYPVEADVMQRRLERLLPRSDHLVLVAESEPTNVVGWTHAAEHDLLESGRCGEILGLVVTADQRGHGIGRSLVEWVERWAGQRGLKQISVRSNIARTESHPFYERIGYTRIKTQHAYRKLIDN